MINKLPRIIFYFCGRDQNSALTSALGDMRIRKFVYALCWIFASTGEPSLETVKTNWNESDYLVYGHRIILCEKDTIAIERFEEDRHDRDNINVYNNERWSSHLGKLARKRRFDTAVSHTYQLLLKSRNSNKMTQTVTTLPMKRIKQRQLLNTLHSKRESAALSDGTLRFLFVGLRSLRLSSALPHQAVFYASDLHGEKVEEH